MHSHYLPEDIIKDIMVKLPAKSLLRFKFLSKSWYAVITDPSFIAKNLEWSKSITKNRGLKFMNRRRQPSVPLSISLACTKEEPCLVQELQFPFYDNHLKLISVYGQCDGIFCLGGIYRERFWCLMLWNPSTKEVKPISKSKRNHRHYFRNGFGFDPITNDYKVVRFSNWPQEKEKRTLVEVYNLSSDSWRIIDLDFVEEAKSCWSPNMNGVYHWFDSSLKKDHVLAFDFSKEAFGRIQLPHGIDPSCVDNVAVVKETLACLVIYPWMLKFEIWAMNEYGVESSWAKNCEIESSLNYYFRSACLFWADFEILIKENNNNNGELISCSLQNQRQQQIQNSHGYVKIIVTQMNDYIESMVPLTQGGNVHKKV